MKGFRWIAVLLWFCVTGSLSGWWWFYAVSQSTVREDSRATRMFMWEGTALLLLVMIGAALIVFATFRESILRERTAMFFSNFTHDLKTSLSRIRLQAEFLKDKYEHSSLTRLLGDLHRLDLQLENSLWISKGRKTHLLLERVKISSLIPALREEFPELNIVLEKDRELLIDSHAFRSILRNSFQNAVTHGQASEVRIQTFESEGPTSIGVRIFNNGAVFSGDLNRIGKEFLPGKDQSSNGLGLYLCRFLVENMGGEIKFLQNHSYPFALEMRLPL